MVYIQYIYIYIYIYVCLLPIRVLPPQGSRKNPRSSRGWVGLSWRLGWNDLWKNCFTIKPQINHSIRTTPTILEIILGIITILEIILILLLFKKVAVTVDGGLLTVFHSMFMRLSSSSLRLLVTIRDTATKNPDQRCSSFSISLELTTTFTQK